MTQENSAVQATVTSNQTVLFFGVVPHSESSVVRPGEINNAIDKLACNKACGLDKVTAEHLKYASHKLSVLLALCFSGLLLHGILPESMLSVLLVTVIKNKTGKLTSINDYRLIALASIMSKAFECAATKLCKSDGEQIHPPHF